MLALLSLPGSSTQLRNPLKVLSSPLGHSICLKDVSRSLFALADKRLQHQKHSVCWTLLLNVTVPCATAAPLVLLREFMCPH